MTSSLLARPRQLAYAVAACGGESNELETGANGDASAAETGSIAVEPDGSDVVADTLVPIETWVDADGRLVQLQAVLGSGVWGQDEDTDATLMITSVWSDLDQSVLIEAPTDAIPVADAPRVDDRVPPSIPDWVDNLPGASARPTLKGTAATIGA